MNAVIVIAMVLSMVNQYRRGTELSCHIVIYALEEVKCLDLYGYLEYACLNSLTYRLCLYNRVQYCSNFWRVLEWQ